MPKGNAFDVGIPQPATLGMVGLALAGLGALRFRKRKLTRG
jgi:PEP-CTERM motif